MCTLLWMVISIEALFKESKINLAKLFFPITFITSSRTFIIVMSFYYLGKLKFSITKNLKIIFILIPIFIIIFINIDWNEISQIILNIARIEDFNIQTILIKESRRFFYYISVFTDIQKYLFLGGGPGYSYKYNLELIGQNSSTESTYLALILDYGLIPSILMLYFFIKASIKSNLISIPNIIIFLFSGLFIPYLDENLIYVFLGLVINPRLDLNERKNEMSGKYNY